MNNKDKYNLKQFVMINNIATHVYNAIQGGVPLNFYACFIEYENGVFGWKKEAVSFQTAIDIYEDITANEAWDIIHDLDEDDYLKKMTPQEIKKLEQELSDYE